MDLEQLINDLTEKAGIDFKDHEFCIYIQVKEKLSNVHYSTLRGNSTHLFLSAAPHKLQEHILDIKNDKND